MNPMDRLYATLKPSLRDISASEFQLCLEGLESALDASPRRRTQLTVRRLRFKGEKSGDFGFQPGVNILRAGNDKGKSSILKLIHFCLTGKNDLKKDVDGWISEVELMFELNGVAHTIFVDKTKRPRGRLVRSAGDAEALQSIDTLVEFKNAKQMQRELERFFNEAFGLRPLMGTQKASRKDSDALLDSPTSYRAYFRGLYINQDLGYAALITDGMPYGNLFMKVVGMLLGVRGIDGMFAVEARRAHLENRLAKEERYHRRLEASLEPRDLATLNEEIDNLERYVDELKVERAALFVRATSNDLDRRLAQVTEKLVAFDDVRQQTAGHLRNAELEMRFAEREASELASALVSHRALASIQPDRCPVCETRIAERQRHTQPRSGQCLLCHEDVENSDDDEFVATVERRLAEARQSLATRRKQIETRRADLDELEFRAKQSAQLKSHLQSQLRSAHQGTAELDREIELETRYLGRLEAERDGVARMVSENGGGSDIAIMLKQKQILGRCSAPPAHAPRRRQRALEARLRIEGSRLLHHHRLSQPRRDQPGPPAQTPDSPERSRLSL